jgi:hypothetical protein
MPEQHPRSGHHRKHGQRSRKARRNLPQRRRRELPPFRTHGRKGQEQGWSRGDEIELEVGGQCEEEQGRGGVGGGVCGEFRSEDLMAASGAEQGGGAAMCREIV